MSGSQYRAHRAQQSAERVLGLLDLEIRLGTARRHLDVMAEFAAVLLDQCTPSLLIAAYREQLDALEHRILARGKAKRAKPRAEPEPEPAPPPPRPSSPPSLRVVKP